MSTYQEVVGAIGNYYGTDSDIWRKVATSGGASLTPSEIAALRQVPGVSVTVAGDGSFRGWDFNNPFPASNNPLSGGNSNVPNASYNSPSSFNGRVNGTYHWDGATQTGRLTSGARNVSTGARVATVAGKINGAITAVSVGMQLGAKIDGALYRLGKFFDLNPPESLNPETWDSIASSEGGKWLIRTLFGIDGNGSTMYLPEDAIDYMYKYWVEQGMFDNNIDASLDDPLVDGIPQPIPLLPGNTIIVYSHDNISFQFRNAEHILVYEYPNGRTFVDAFSRQTATPIEISQDGGQTWSSSLTYTDTTLKGTPYQYNTYIDFSYPPSNIATGNIYFGETASPNHDKINTIIIDGSITQVLPGVEPAPGQTMVDPSQVPSGTPITQAYPQLFQNPIKETVPQPDGTNKDIIYYPVPWPSIPTDTDKPVSGTPSQTDPTVTPTNPTDETDPLRDVITNPLPQPSTPTPGGPATPPDTGGGSSPTPVAPTGEASSMWAVYNPTQAQLDDFGSWLWSSNMVDQIKKLFADPMQAIIGVHKVYVTPPTGSQVNIKCGYIDSGCPAAKVTGQYVTVDCGTVNVREYYGNVLDYAPYTEVSLYLPFIGIVKLDVADVMRGSVSVKYHVDVITGACLAEVKVNRDGESAIMYQYSGSAIVTYPVSSGSYASAVTGVLSLAAGVAGTIMTGGAAAPALIGGAVGLSHLHADVQHSGGFSGSPGAMGGKKPYLIISRAQDATPADFEKYEGKPASKTVKLSNCDGFVRVKAINIDAVPATYQELDQIVSLLKTGVII